MNASGFDVDALIGMAHSPVRNYIVPGLTSWLIGNPGPNGTIRLFVCERDHQEPITPHSHRFDFQCWVLSGKVTNRIWTQPDYWESLGYDKFVASRIQYKGAIGEYEVMAGNIGGWKHADTVFSAGDCYSMKCDEVHSIYFSRGTKVLFFEGKVKENSSLILEPYVNGERVPTFKVEPWMFKREE